MTGAVIENLSNRKLFTLLTALALIQAMFFLLGALCSPVPSTSMDFLMTKCQDISGGRSNEWFHLRPSNCKTIEDLMKYTPTTNDMRDIVFIAQMPHVRDGHVLEYSAWFQFLLGLLEVEIDYHPSFSLEENAELQLEVRLGYRRVSDPIDKWNELISTNITRTLSCTIHPNNRLEGHAYNCSVMDLFELGANAYPFYLINLRLPVDAQKCRQNPKGPNCAIGRINNLRIIAIHQNGGFTTIWLWMKTLSWPFVLLATIWYWRRVSALPRRSYLIEKAIFSLGLSLVMLDLPIEWLSLWFRLPFMLLVGDIRQGLFYTMLFSFWLIFTGEHLIDDSSRNALGSYWRNLTFVGIAATSLLVYDIAERGMQLYNPFYSIWASNLGTAIAYLAIYLAFICSVLYFCFLIYKVYMVWMTIRRKRAGALYRTSETRKLRVDSVIFRFKFLMCLTVACAFFTILSYMMKQWGEGQMHSDEPMEGMLVMHSTSAFFTGTFGMWNIYVVFLLAMYAPSHKRYVNATVLNDEMDDLMDPIEGPTEQSALTTFTKAATD